MQTVKFERLLSNLRHFTRINASWPALVKYNRHGNSSRAALLEIMPL